MLQASQRSNNTSIPKLNPISPVDMDNNVCQDDISETSTIIKQEPGNDSSPQVDSFHSMSEALQTVSNVFIYYYISSGKFAVTNFTIKEIIIFLNIT